MCVPGAPVDDDAVVQSHDISPGDYVKVELDPEIFRAMHEGSEKAGWNDHMLEVIYNNPTIDVGFCIAESVHRTR